eukprot:CAMPEP_0183342034 /NCGR_PEP_ID=MMETSP0164_2-20130417/8211_1 /TAXON_ID=221442 /ORGANISM="Coccolithus pelagicus ssp braarudi, Strain PLY182g" /LENGTH=178 /DNA_ID=CAMNT_0025512509 /DNA_START=244 /DNA_END=778 /DNA_ORIENTATION=-
MSNGTGAASVQVGSSGLSASGWVLGMSVRKGVGGEVETGGEGGVEGGEGRKGLVQRPSGGYMPCEGAPRQDFEHPAVGAASSTRTAHEGERESIERARVRKGANEVADPTRGSSASGSGSGTWAHGDFGAVDADDDVGSESQEEARGRARRGRGRGRGERGERCERGEGESEAWARER